ncbi:MAG TPA: MBL fold metallo-hydrolase [Acidimicrobiales bacterium]|nr:MBL fold metallo-hydrolase [Acidimicrobiales bacterium]
MGLTSPGADPIVFDLGTGLRSFGETQPLDGTFAGTALVTHIHWDHVQGLPFFPAADRDGARFDIYGPQQDEGALKDLIDDFMRPPYFPVRVSDLRGTYRFHEVLKDDFRIGDAEVLVRPVPHVGPTVGYRVSLGGRVVTYISDHQAPPDLDTISETVLELAAGADVLIHDAQYTRAEFAEKSHWGHCTIDYAIRVGRKAGVKKLVMFHHDPSHGDDCLDRLLAEARASAGPGDPEILAAFEGLRISL